MYCFLTSVGNGSERHMECWRALLTPIGNIKMERNGQVFPLDLFPFFYILSVPQMGGESHSPGSSTNLKSTLQFYSPMPVFQELESADIGQTAGWGCGGVLLQDRHTHREETEFPADNWVLQA